MTRSGCYPKADPTVVDGAGLALLNELCPKSLTPSSWLDPQALDVGPPKPLVEGNRADRIVSRKCSQDDRAPVPPRSEQASVKLSEALLHPVIVPQVIGGCTDPDTQIGHFVTRRR